MRMTGKEALEYIANLLLMFTSTGRKSGKNYTLKALCKIEDELDELAKYKRAFEIFKKYNTFTMVGRNKDDEDYVISTIRNLMFLDKEEYELLEELMKDA